MLFPARSLPSPSALCLCTQRGSSFSQCSFCRPGCEQCDCHVWSVMLFFFCACAVSTKFGKFSALTSSMIVFCPCLTLSPLSLSLSLSSLSGFGCLGRAALVPDSLVLCLLVYSPYFLLMPSAAVLSRSLTLPLQSLISREPRLVCCSS